MGMRPEATADAEVSFENLLLFVPQQNERPCSERIKNTLSQRTISV